MKLTERQVELLVGGFFDTQTGFPGAAAIARELLGNGTCVVAGDGVIWRGGVGNFIRIDRNIPGFVGCSRLTLDFERFLSTTEAQAIAASRAGDAERVIEDLQRDATAWRDLLTGPGRESTEQDTK
jgi:hypothetical protein